ncbi:uncharacterized protein BDR25DRAFT_304010 [Lindgomyces ingoldianus]|uniref:Uncharacterized protein n=1 Tax=Lindgomyces ingoldianus TaxID=673940 RepID=A0ACB6QSR3_9PLEO|nr:uncharacterized protein BDR25DRAFT_304010 [Lindgomyces ingoldianus]KAF2470024.1 hypothetical protein BDR25DRAFT_304010 [Lindgomyces ingoldianus]
MSGFEIAGVVLGSLPLIISALEHYAEGIATAKRFWKYKTELRSLILQVNTERGIFINTLEQLLTGIVRGEHMDDFLSNRDLWKEKYVDAKLKSRLRGAYDIYLGNVRGMEIELRKMMEKLVLGPDGKPQFTDPSTFKQEYRRLKFSISKSEYSDVLKNLKNYNQQLTRLTKQSLELEPTRSTENKNRCPNFKAFQSYARSLYTTLKSGWRCGCPGHAVNLRLENRSNKLATEDEILEKTPFRVIFSYTTSSEASASMWDWKEADIRWIADTPTQRTPLLPCAHNAIGPGTKRRVRFEQIGIQVQTTTGSTGTTIVASKRSTPSSPAYSQIQDLCKTIAKLQQPYQELCIGYLLDSVQRKHGIYLLDPPITCQPQQWATYSLKEVLARNPNVKRRLTQQDKLRVAVDLASSVLQLYKTPWIEEQLAKDDVFFIHRPGASLYDHPYVCRRFTPQITTGTPSTPGSAPSCRVIRNQTLFTLGILLIELWYGKPIEALSMPSDLDCRGTPGVEWCTADRIVENEIEFEAGKCYSEAVRRCIRCDFDRKDMSLENESFQQAVYDGVVALLETTLQQFTGSSLD